MWVAAARSSSSVALISRRMSVSVRRARLDRLKQDQSLLALLLGQDGEGKGGGFGGAFAPEGNSSV